MTFLLPPEITTNIHPTISSPKLTFLCQSVIFVHLYVVANWNSFWSVMQIIISNRLHSQTTRNLCYMLNCTIIICITTMLRCCKWCSGFHLLGAVPTQLHNLSTSVSVKPCLCLSALLLGAKYTHTQSIGWKAEWSALTVWMKMGHKFVTILSKDPYNFKGRNRNWIENLVN